jgi:hypothetical protein
MFLPVLKNVHDAGPDLVGCSESASVISIAPDPPCSACRSIDRSRRPNDKRANSEGQRAAVTGLDHEMNVIGLDRKVDHPKAIGRRDCDCRTNGVEGNILPE